MSKTATTPHAKQDGKYKQWLGTVKSILKEAYPGDDDVLLAGFYDEQGLKPKEAAQAYREAQKQKDDHDDEPADMITRPDPFTEEAIDLIDGGPGLDDDALDDLLTPSATPDPEDLLDPRQPAPTEVRKVHVSALKSGPLEGLARVMREQIARRPDYRPRGGYSVKQVKVKNRFTGRERFLIAPLKTAVNQLPVRDGDDVIEQLEVMMEREDLRDRILKGHGYGPKDPLGKANDIDTSRFVPGAKY